MKPELPDLLKGLYTPPFRYDNKMEEIVDFNDAHVLDVAYYIDTPPEKQKAFGEYVAKLLNENWE